MRTKTNKRIPDGIVTGDWHLREDTPICRTDNFQEAQWKKVDFIASLQKEFGCPVIHTGDLFNHWKPSPALLSKTFRYLPENFYTIYGNHDLPQHNLELAYKCGINVLEAAGALTVCSGTHWGFDPAPMTHSTLPKELRYQLIWHVMTYAGKEPWPGCPDIDINVLLKKYKEYNTIFTGHNHTTFVVTDENRLLINPGSITRQTADQEKHKPCVFLWYAEDNSFEEIELPIEKGVISREHIDKKNERNDRIDAFITRLDNDFQASLNFEDNLEKLIAVNDVRDSVKTIIYKALET